MLRFRRLLHDSIFRFPTFSPRIISSTASMSSQCQQPAWISAQENMDRYTMGGYGRYEVLRKLGHGEHSTIWMVKDCQSPYVKQLLFYICQLSPYERKQKSSLPHSEDNDRYIISFYTEADLFRALIIRRAFDLQQRARCSATFE
jgi:hypothetical protein